MEFHLSSLSKSSTKLKDWSNRSMKKKQSKLKRLLKQVDPRTISRSKRRQKNVDRADGELGRSRHGQESPRNCSCNSSFRNGGSSRGNNSNSSSFRRIICSTSPNALSCSGSSIISARRFSEAISRRFHHSTTEHHHVRRRHNSHDEEDEIFDSFTLPDNVSSWDEDDENDENADKNNVRRIDGGDDDIMDQAESDSTDENLARPLVVVVDTLHETSDCRITTGTEEMPQQKNAGRVVSKDTAESSSDASDSSTQSSSSSTDMIVEGALEMIAPFPLSPAPTSPSHSAQHYHKRQRSVQFSDQLTTAVTYDSRLSSSSKHKLFYTKQEIDTFRTEAAVAAVQQAQEEEAAPFAESCTTFSMVAASSIHSPTHLTRSTTQMEDNKRGHSFLSLFMVAGQRLVLPRQYRPLNKSLEEESMIEFILFALRGLMVLIGLELMMNIYLVLAEWR